MLGRLWQKICNFWQDQGFLASLARFENGVSKVLALAMVGVILLGIADLLYELLILLENPWGNFSTLSLDIFGLFLNILIALEILENLTANMSKHGVLELVIATALTAVARKIIIFDTKSGKVSIAELGIAVLTLTLSYWLVRQTKQPKDKE